MQNRLIDFSRIDFLGRHEQFGDDLAAICARISIPCTEVPRLNASERSVDYREYYDGELVERVARAYGLDLQIFGYRF